MDCSLYSATVLAAFARLLMCLCLPQISLILCDACGKDDLWMSYIFAASAGVVSVHFGGLGIASLVLYSSLFSRYVTSL